MKKTTEAMATPVIQVFNVLKNKYTRESTAHEVVRRTSEEYKAAKAEGKNFTRIYGPDKCFILAPVKSNGVLTAHGRKLREVFLNGYKK